MAKPEYHVFICTQHRAEGHPRGSCTSKDSETLLNAFYRSIMQKQLLAKVTITATGCIGPCLFGANVLVYPQGIMYGNVTTSDIETIVQQHLIDGVPVLEKCVPADVW